MLNTKTNEEGSSQRRGIIYNGQGIVKWLNSSSISNAFSETLMGDSGNTPEIESRIGFLRDQMTIRYFIVSVINRIGSQIG